ncbi:MAG: hypothetical protein JXX14_10115, partial [Deltaproteobacteria bacterium]|nr:hypothetical protein [Deltaproteobacteria bacterium]
AYDQQLSTTLYASGYSVRAANGTLIDRRNILQELSLGAWNILPGSGTLDYDGPRLSIQANLRLGGDYGVNNSEMSIDRLDRFVPGLDAMYVEAVFAYVDLQGLANEHLDVRLGRIIRADTAGYAAFDGAELTLHWPFGIGVNGFWGYDVNRAKPFGYDSLALDGVDNVGRDGLDDAYLASLVETESAMVFGAEVTVTPSSWLDAALTFRQTGYGHRLQQQTVAGHLAAGTERVRSYVRVVTNPLLDRYDNLGGALREGTLVSEATAELGMALGKKGWGSLGYELYRPVFMLDSIFNIFGQLGRRDMVVRYERRVSVRMQWATWSNVRFLDSKHAAPAAEQDTPVIGGGGGTGFNYGTFQQKLSGRVSVDNELGATRLGVEQSLGHRYWDDRLWLSVRGSYWYVRDALYGKSKHIAGYVLSANHQFNEKARALFEFENYYGADTPRFVLTALIQLDVWR